jgi:hypothetical protein
MTDQKHPRGGITFGDFRYHPEYRPDPIDVDVRLSHESAYALRNALEVIKRKPLAAALTAGNPARRKAIAALDAVCLMIWDIFPSDADTLCAPLRALEDELRDMEDGALPGEITRKLPKKGRRGDSSAVMIAQARAVLAVNWLQCWCATPLSRQEALRLVAKAVRRGPTEIEQWMDYFAENDRRRKVLKELLYDLEITYAVDIAGASQESVIAWLCADRSREISQIDRAVFAYNWLRRIGLNQSDALTRIAAAGYPPTEIEERARHFKEKPRRNDALSKLTQEVKTNGINFTKATPHDVLAWLCDGAPSA